MFRIGDKVVYIEEKSEYVIDGIFKPRFTIGKTYLIEHITYDILLWCEDDNGEYKGHNGKCFISLKEYRKRKLKKILDE